MALPGREREGAVALLEVSMAGLFAAEVAR
jgi:hypothetical protein